jgi:hypothetical protein
MVHHVTQGATGGEDIAGSQVRALLICNSDRPASTQGPRRRQYPANTTTPNILNHKYLQSHPLCPANTLPALPMARINSTTYTY